MRRLVKIVSPEEWEKWNKSQKSFYFSSIRNTDEDPFKGKPIYAEALLKGEEMKGMLKKALDTANANMDDRTLRLDNIYFETGSSKLSIESEIALNILKEPFDQYPILQETVSCNTANFGDLTLNMKLSHVPSRAVKNILNSNVTTGEEIKTYR